MAKLFKTTITISLFILIFSLSFVYFATRSSAIFDKQLMKLFECQYILEVETDENATNNPLLPLDKTIDIPLKIKFKVEGDYADLLIPYYSTFEAYVDIFVNNTPEWCTATISPYQLRPRVSIDWVVCYANLNIKIDDTAPASKDGAVEIIINAPRAGSILAHSFNIKIPFTVGYLPILDIKSETIKKINPTDTARFNIELENLGNDKTNVNFHVINAPEGWIVNINKMVTIGTKTLNDDTKETVTLDIKPPYGFGYHNDREVIQVSITPSYYKNDSLAGEEYIVSFIVQSEGFSTPGFESLYLIVALIMVAFFIKKGMKTKDKYLKSNNRREGK